MEQIPDPSTPEPFSPSLSAAADITTARQPAEGSSADDENQGIVRAAAVLAAGNVASRVLGLAREMVKANLFGTSPLLAAFQAAAYVPTSLFDLIIGGMSITPERNLTGNFTLPYANSGIHLVAHKQLAAGFKPLEDFDKPDVVLAVRRGATPATAAKRLMPKATLRQFDEDALALQEVLNGKAHAFVTSTPTPAFEALKHPDTLFLPISEPFVQGAEGFALRKGDPDALNFFNNWILLRQQDGWLKERHDYWFKTRDWAGRVAE